MGVHPWVSLVSRGVHTSDSRSLQDVSPAFTSLLDAQDNSSFSLDEFLEWGLDRTLIGQTGHQTGHKQGTGCSSTASDIEHRADNV